MKRCEDVSRPTGVRTLYRLNLPAGRPARGRLMRKHDTEKESEIYVDPVKQVNSEGL